MLDITYNPELKTESGGTMTKATIEFECGNESAIKEMFEFASVRMGTAQTHIETSDVQLVKRFYAIGKGKILNMDDVPS
jgi:hypothetical protein